MSKETFQGKKSFLVVQRGGEIGSLFYLDKTKVTIGRNADNVIPLDDSMVSRYHAVIQQDPGTGEVSVIDLGSTNGVFVNEEQIDPGLPFSLQNRDLIFVGHSVFNLQVRPENYKPNPPLSRLSDPEVTQHLEMKKLFS